MNNFDTSDYAMFSVGEFQDAYPNLSQFSDSGNNSNIAIFRGFKDFNQRANEVTESARKKKLAGEIDEDWRKAKSQRRKQQRTKGRKFQTQVKAFVRKTKNGGLALVKGGMRKVGQNKKLAGGLAVGGAVAGGVGYATRKKRRQWNAANDRALKAINRGDFK